MTEFQKIRPYYDERVCGQPNFHQCYPTEFTKIEAAVNPSNLVAITKVNEKYDAKSSKRPIGSRLTSKPYMNVTHQQLQESGERPMISGLLYNDSFHPRFKFRPLSNIVSALTFESRESGDELSRPEIVAMNRAIGGQAYPISSKERMLEIYNKIEAEEIAQDGFKELELDLTKHRPPGLDLAVSMQKLRSNEESIEASHQPKTLAGKILVRTAKQSRPNLAYSEKFVRDKYEKTLDKIDKNNEIVANVFKDINNRRTEKLQIQPKHQSGETVALEEKLIGKRDASNSELNLSMAKRSAAVNCR